MEYQRPNLSLTLPNNPYLHHGEDTTPRTPERPIRASVAGVPVAQTTQSRFRLRRKSGGRALSSNLFAPPISTSTSETAIPSIEIASEGFTADAPQGTVFGGQNEAFLSPLTPHSHDVPTTPLAQTASFDGDSWLTAKQRELGDSIIRPMSQCSTWSDSSDDSDSLSTVASSYGTTCTSPDRAGGEALFTPSKDDGFVFSQSLFDAGRISEMGASHGQPKKTKINWTMAMDDHLWTVYQMYLQDPTATPIKTLPGNAPPLGVCHRVARQAKHTWREPRLRSLANRFSTPQPLGSPKVQVPRESALSDIEGAKPQSKASANWPKLGATRRRLRELAKSRATIAPHYMRLIAGRTPSPFASSSVQSGSTRRNSNAPPSSSGHRLRHSSKLTEQLDARDVRLALVTATSETMQPNGPLAQLQRASPLPSPEPVSAPAQPSFAFNFNDPAVPFASPAPAPSSAVRSNSVDQNMLDAPAEAPPRLGSPFVPRHGHTWAPGRRQKLRGAVPTSAFQPPEPAQSTEETQQHLTRPATSTGPPSLRSPIHFTSSFPYNRSLGSKRRAEHALEDTSPRHVAHRRPALNVEDIFGPPLQGQSRAFNPIRTPVESRRVRLRGFSLGDAITHDSATRHAAEIDEAQNSAPLPQIDDPFTDGPANFSGQMQAGTLTGAPRMLGSPFRASETSTVRLRRFKVRHLPHNSLDTYPENLFGSIEERLGGGQ